MGKQSVCDGIMIKLLHTGELFETCALLLMTAASRWTVEHHLQYLHAAQSPAGGASKLTAGDRLTSEDGVLSTSSSASCSTWLGLMSAKNNPASEA